MDQMKMTKEQWNEAVLTTDTYGVDVKNTVTAADFARALVDDDAYITGRCMPAHDEGSTEYAQRMIIGGQALMCYWIFDRAEVEAAGDDEGSLPWGFDHVDRIETAG
jgi:hypothetical protein